MTGDIVAVCALGIVVCVVCLALRQYRPEYAVCVGLCFTSVLLIYLLGRMSDVLGLLDEVAESSGISKTFFAPVVKCLGISIAVGFAADTCSDAGQSALASKVEFAGKLAVLYLCIPMLRKILEVIRGLLD